MTIEEELRDLIKGEKDKNSLLIKLSIIKHYDINVFMDIMYDALMDNKDLAIVSQPHLSEDKTEALTKMIQHYEDLHIYEKCAKLKRIKDEINE